MFPSQSWALTRTSFSSGLDSQILLTKSAFGESMAQKCSTFLPPSCVALTSALLLEERLLSYVDGRFSQHLCSLYRPPRVPCIRTCRLGCLPILPSPAEAARACRCRIYTLPVVLSQAVNSSLLVYSSPLYPFLRERSLVSSFICNTLKVY